MCSRLRVYTTARLRGCGILPGRVSARVHGAGPTPRVQDPACWSARDDARRHPKVLRGGGRGSARLVQGGGWVSSLMARWGCGAMALVVVMGVWGPWKRRMRPGGRVSQGGRDQRSVAGAQLVAVLARDHVPDPVEAVLNVPVAAGPGRDLLGAGLVHGKRAEPGRRPRWSSSCRRRACWWCGCVGSGVTRAAPGKSIHWGAWTTLRVRRTRRPWEPSGAEMAGMSFHGRSLSVWCRPGWLSLTVSR